MRDLAPKTSKRIDWDEVRSKLKANQEALAKTFDSDPEKNALAFKARAQRMAARVNSAREVETVAVMSFLVGTERYGILLSELSEIRPYVNCTSVPGTPSELKGVVAIRGEIRSVIDLSRILGISVPEDCDDKGYMLLLKSEETNFALKVSQVNEVEQIPLADVEACQSAQTSLLGHYLRGVGQDSMIYLNLNQVLSHPIFKGIS